MAAAKYGLDYKKLNRTQEMQDMRDFKDFAFFKDWTDPETGREYKRGEGYQINMKDMLAGKFETMPLVLPDYMESVLADEATLAQARFEALDTDVLEVTDLKALRTSRENHTDALKQVRHATLFSGYLKGLIGNEKYVVGARGWMIDKVSRLKNFVGATGDEYDILERWHNKDAELSDAVAKGLGDDIQQRYRVQLTEISNNLLREILGEASKNISNVDRELAREIVGLFSGAELSQMSPELLNQRLQNTLTNVEAKAMSGWDTIAAEEAAWVEKYLSRSARARREPEALRLIRRREQEFGTTFEVDYGLEDESDKESSRGKITYNWNEIFDTSTNSFTWPTG
jgi:hypothetical protein